ncbi:DUF4231 domain-containing protein [Ideonella sp. A 288]|uniref:DUF4231 domain-containing protein n=1 Tax=Ideonella sp. A 288 TaxID=1962181 RepID=UPI001185E2E1|nr:DUF4231 domain-containing protein [Ideonella sp. A 288]
MSNNPSTGRTLGKVVLALLAVAVVWWWLQPQAMGSRGEALADALQPLIDGKDAEAAPAAKAILANFHETRTIAAQWSGVYWGFTFLAAALSAAAGLVLKVETLLTSDKARKDIAAVCSVLAALLITVSTSGDFQRKWQANRVAAAELEHLGYQLLEAGGEGARTHMGTVGQILLRRHLAIVGGIEPPRGAASAASAARAASAAQHWLRARWRRRHRRLRQ